MIRRCATALATFLTKLGTAVTRDKSDLSKKAKPARRRPRAVPGCCSGLPNAGEALRPCRDPSSSTQSTSWVTIRVRQPTQHPRHLPVRSFTIPAADVLTKHPKQQQHPGTALQTQQRDGTGGGNLLGRRCVSKDTTVGEKCKWDDPAARRLLSSTMLHRCWSSGWHLVLAGRRPSSASGE